MLCYKGGFISPLALLPQEPKIYQVTVQTERVQPFNGQLHMVIHIYLKIIFIIFKQEEFPYISSLSQCFFILFLA